MARDQRLNVEITADDRASAKITSVAGKVERLDGETATPRIDADASGFNSVVDALDDKLGGMIGTLRGAAGPGGAVLALAGAIGLAAEQAADLAIEADNTARLTGDSVQEASKLSGIWRQAGFDNKDLQDVLLQMNGVLSTNKGLAADLGINLDDGRSIGERFQQVVRILGSDFTDAGRRSQLASQLFGEEGVRQVNAVEGAYGDLATAVDDYSGRVFTPADVAKAREYKSAIADIKTEFSNLAAEVGTDVLPEITSVLTVLTDIKRKADEIGASDAADQFLNPWGGAKVVLGEVNDLLKDDIKPNLVEIGRAAVDDAMTGIESFDGAAERARTRVERLGDDGETAMQDIEDGADDAKAAVRRVQDAFAGLRSEISNRQALRDLQDQFDQTETAAVDAFGAAKSGAADAETKARDAAREQDNLRVSVLNYGTAVLGLPEQRLTSILALIDQDRLAEAEAQLATLARTRLAQFELTVNGTVRNVPSLPGSRYASGTQFHPGGPATFGEPGNPEVAILPDGSAFMPNMPAGTKVLNRSMMGSVGSGGSGGFSLNVAPGAIVVNGNASGDDIVRALDNYVRRGGTIPADLRRRFGA